MTRSPGSPRPASPLGLAPPWELRVLRPWQEQNLPVATAPSSSLSGPFCPGTDLLQRLLEVQVQGHQELLGGGGLLLRVTLCGTLRWQSTGLSRAQGRTRQDPAGLALGGVLAESFCSPPPTPDHRKAHAPWTPGPTRILMLLSGWPQGLCTGCPPLLLSLPEPGWAEARFRP